MILRTILAVAIAVAAQRADAWLRERTLRMRRGPALPPPGDPRLEVAELRPTDYGDGARGLVVLRILLRPAALVVILLLVFA